MDKVTLPTKPVAPAKSRRLPVKTWVTFSSGRLIVGESGRGLLHVDHDGGGDAQQADAGRAAHEAARLLDGLGERVGAVPAEQRPDVVVLRARDDDLARVLAAVLAPVPHVERVHAVGGVALAVQVHVARVLRELALE